MMGAKLDVGMKLMSNASI